MIAFKKIIISLIHTLPKTVNKKTENKLGILYNSSTMSFISLPEKEIQRSILNFIQYMKLDVSSTQLGNFMKLTKEKRRMNLTKDTFLLTCEFLAGGEMVCFATTCKQYMEYYPYIWKFYQKQYFPKSIIPKIDYKTIRLQASLDCYHFILFNRDYTNNVCWHEINEDDKTLRRISDDLGRLTINSINYRVRLITNKRNMISCHGTRNEYLSESDEKMKDFLETYSFNSLTDDSGTKYLTIKPDLDMRLYGFDPKIPEERKKGDIKIKWVTGEYNEFRDYNIRAYDDEEPGFEYYWGDDRYGDHYRVRIRPDYC